MSLNKFTHIPLLNNDAIFFFFLSGKLPHKKEQSPKIFYKNKKHVPKKKSHLVKIKINYHAQALKNQKEKKK